MNQNQIENTNLQEKQFEKEAMKVSTVSIVVNVLLSLFKLLAGVIAHSGAMISDAIHSASDVFSTIIVMVGIHLAGRKSDKEHPFIVSTSKYQVKAVGTSFNVYDYQDSPQFEAALLNGKVEVTTNAKKSSVVILTPNQRAALCQGVLKVKPIENTNNYLWRKGILYFNEPLLEVFDKLQEYYDVEFQIRNTSLTRKSPYCTGKFRAKDGLEHIIRVLKETNHFDYQIDYENKKIIIL